MEERDFDDVTPTDESNSRAVIQVGLKSFSSKNEVKCSFEGGGLKIWTNIDGEVYSKTIDGLTEKHVQVVEIKKSKRSFAVILKKKEDLSLEDKFFNG